MGNIQVNSKNELYGAVDYSLSSLIVNNGPQVFIFKGVSSEQLQYNNFSNIKSIMVDNEDNIWCAGYGVYAVYNGVNWTIDDSSLKDNICHRTGAR